MSFIDGYVIAVPTENKEKFIDHGNNADSVFMDLGAIRVVECWGEDVPKGETTDFHRAVQAKENESIVFSWVEWPDRETREKAMEKMNFWMENPEQCDPRMDPEKHPMPFDGKRLIYGGFETLIDLKK